MPHFPFIIIASLLIQVLLMCPGVYGGEEDCIGSAGQGPINCYECITLTEDNYCADPFNDTHPNLALKRCKEYCVKWTRLTSSGKTLVQRTCSSNMDIRLRKTSVCMEESRPSEGLLCFCDTDKCNAAISIKGNNSLLTICLAFITKYVLTYVQRIRS
ncbi:hypothetical protein ACF0H5_011703 [Mactra antiquata]